MAINVLTVSEKESLNFVKWMMVAYFIQKQIASDFEMELFDKFCENMTSTVNKSVYLMFIEQQSITNFLL